MNKIFIIGTITKDLPKEFIKLKNEITLKFNYTSTYDSKLKDLEKINYVYKNIEEANLIIAFLPTITFGTSFEIGFSTAKNKKIIIITSQKTYDEHKLHPILKQDNIYIKIINSDDIIFFIQNLL